MNIDINLVSSLKVGEYLQVSETEVLACVEKDRDGCERCVYYYEECDLIQCENVNGLDVMYTSFKLKQ